MTPQKYAECIIVENGKKINGCFVIVIRNDILYSNYWLLLKEASTFLKKSKTTV